MSRACARPSLRAICFDLAHVQTALDDVFRNFERVRLPDKLTRVTGRQLAGQHQRLHRLRQLEQAHRVGDMRAALADDLRDVVLAVIEFFHQRQIAARLLDRR